MYVSSEVGNLYSDFLRPYSTQSQEGQGFDIDLSLSPDSFEAKKNSKKRNVAIISLSAAMLLVASTLLLKPGTGVSLQKNLRRLADLAEAKLDEANNPWLRARLEQASRGFNGLAQGLNVGPNIGTNGKDIVMKKVSRYIPPLEWADKKTSALYTHMGKKGVANSYKKAQTLFAQADDSILKELQRLEAQGADAELIKRAREIINARSKSISELVTGQELRYARLNEEVMKGLEDKVGQEMFDTLKSKGPGKFKKFLTHFFSENILRKDKEQVQSALNASRKAITNNLDDVLKDLTSETGRLKGYVKLDDAASWDLLIKLEKTLKPNGTVSHAQIDDVKRAADALNRSIRQGQYDAHTQKSLEGVLRSINGIIAGNNKGYTEELKDVLVSLGLREKYDAQIRGVTREARKALTKGVGFEGNEFFDKMRDIKLGCAPTDFYGIAMAGAGLGIYIKQADSKEERVSGTLTKGVPLMTSIAVSTLAAAKMISGVKAMLFGGAAGLVAGVTGGAINKLYKKKHNVDDRTYTLPSFKDVPKELPEIITGDDKKAKKAKKVKK